MCAQSQLKTRSKEMSLVRSNGRVTDTSSAETNSLRAQPRYQLRLAPGIKCRGFLKLLSERESSRMSAEAAVQDDGAKRTDGLASAEAVTGDFEEACSIVAVAATTDYGMSCGDCRDDVSGAVREEACVSLLMVRS